MSAEPQDAGAPICDAVTLEVIRGALRASQSEMEALIERTAMSAFIREKKDFFVALFDAEGDMIVGAYRPSFGDPVRPIFEHYPAAEMKPGMIVTPPRARSRIRRIRCSSPQSSLMERSSPSRKAGPISLISAACGRARSRRTARIFSKKGSSFPRFVWRRRV